MKLSNFMDYFREEVALKLSFCLRLMKSEPKVRMKPLFSMDSRIDFINGYYFFL